VNTPTQNIFKTLNGKRVIFLENSNGLYHGLDVFENILKERGIKYKILLNLSQLPIDRVLKDINNTDVIVFQTQWVYPISNKLFEYISSLKKKKIIVEVPVGNHPTWDYKPKGIIHDVYWYRYLDEGDDRKKEGFYKLSRKPYWNYKNQFDK